MEATVQLKRTRDEEAYDPQYCIICQASKFIRQKQYYDNITKYKQCNVKLPEGNPSIELVAYSKI